MNRCESMGITAGAAQDSPFPISFNTVIKSMSSEGFVHPSTYRDADGNIAPENREAWLKSMEEMSKDRFVEIEELEVLRQRVSNCFKKEGVNHMENCKADVDAYIRFMAENGFSS